MKNLEQLIAAGIFRALCKNKKAIDIKLAKEIKLSIMNMIREKNKSAEVYE